MYPDNENVRVCIQNIFHYTEKGGDIKLGPDKGKGMSISQTNHSSRICHHYTHVALFKIKFINGIY